MPSGDYCKVDGCHSTLTTSYCRKHQACRSCRRSVVVLLHGAPCRWCQQCARFHQVTMFDGNKRACREKLALMKQRRKEADAALLAASNAGAEGSAKAADATCLAIGWAAENYRLGDDDEGCSAAPTMTELFNLRTQPHGLQPRSNADLVLQQLLDRCAITKGSNSRADAACTACAKCYSSLPLSLTSTPHAHLIWQCQPHFQSWGLSRSHIDSVMSGNNYLAIDDPFDVATNSATAAPTQYTTATAAEPLTPQTSSATSLCAAEQDREQLRWATRVSLHLAGCLPHELPPDLHQQLLYVVSNNSTEALQSMLSWC